jgi:hypothetical protein
MPCWALVEARIARTVARLLDEAGHRTPNGSKFTNTTVERLLQDPTAKGDAARQLHQIFRGQEALVNQAGKKRLGLEGSRADCFRRTLGAVQLDFWVTNQERQETG